MEIRNREDLLNFIKYTINLDKLDSYVVNNEGKLVRYIDSNEDEYAYVLNLLNEIKVININPLSYLYEIVKNYKREYVHEGFDMDGFDFFRSETFKTDHDVSDRTDRERYLKMMYEIFEFDFSEDSVQLYFLNEHEDISICNYIILNSYKEHAMMKDIDEYLVDDEELMFIGSYSSESYLVTKNGRVYDMHSSMEDDEDDWEYICELKDIKKELQKWNIRELRLLELVD